MVERPPIRQDLITDWHNCYEYVNGQLGAYDRMAERGELSDIGIEEREDLLVLRAFYRRMLDQGE